MASGTVITNKGQTIMLNRTFKAVPDYLEPSQFKIGTGTTTPLVSDTDVETVVDITAGVEEKEFVTAYPVIDETNNQVTFRGFLNSLEGNGNSITEFGIFNEDASSLMYSHAVFTAITKTSAVEVSFVQKDKLE